jgi:hypothetical protein
MVRPNTVHVLFPLTANKQVIAGLGRQWCPVVKYHLVILLPNRFAAATPAIASRQVVIPRKILERFIKWATF